MAVCTIPLLGDRATTRGESIQCQTLPFHQQRAQELNVHETLGLLEVGVYLKDKLVIRDVANGLSKLVHDI
jgi:hypothetical protein